MRALRRRYGRASVATSDTYSVEQSGNLFVVRLTRPLAVGSSGRTVPAGKTLGTINERGTISIWQSAGSNPRGYTEAARSLLEAARADLKASGRIMARQRAREASEEQSSGSFIVKVGATTQRFHDFARARAWVEGELAGMPIGTRAEFYRATVGAPREGMPWTVPFHVEEAYEWNGQRRTGNPRGIPR